VSVSDQISTSADHVHSEVTVVDTVTRDEDRVGAVEMLPCADTVPPDGAPRARAQRRLRIDTDDAITDVYPLAVDSAHGSLKGPMPRTRMRDAAARTSNEEHGHHDRGSGDSPHHA
jgi:hypothetical protein